MKEAKTTKEEGRKIREQVWGPGLKDQLRDAMELADLVSTSASRTEAEIEDPCYGSIHHVKQARQALQRALYHFNEAMELGR